MCALCEWTQPPQSDASTSNLLHHVLQAHSIKRSCLDVLPTTNAQTQLKFAAAPPRRKIIAQLMRWLLSDLRPLSTPNSIHFKEFVSLLGVTEGTIPDSTNLTRTYLPKLYGAGRAAVAKCIEGADSVTFTFDGWTEKYTVRAYMTLCAVVVKNWKVHSLCLGTEHIRESHTADFLAAWVQRLLTEWKIPIAYPLIAATTDNTAVMPLTLSKLGVFHFPCIAHLLNLIMQECFLIDAVVPFVKRLRQICKFMRKSHTAAGILEVVAKENKDAVLAACRTMYGNLADETKRKLPVRLKRCVKTRWNSTLDMLRRLWVLYPSVVITAQRLIGLRHANIPEALKEASAADQDNILTICRVLNDLSVATVVVQEHTTPTLGRTFLALMYAHRTLTRAVAGQAGLGRRIATLALTKLDERFFNPDSIFRSPQPTARGLLPQPVVPQLPIASAFDLCLIAAVLDPRTSLPVRQTLQNSNLLPAQRGSVGDPAKAHLIALIRNAAGIAAPHATHATPENSDEEVLDFGAANYFQKRQRTTAVQNVGLIEQINSFFGEDLRGSIDCDPYLYWKTQSERWPDLAKVAVRFLVVQPSSADAERTFSTAGDIVTAQRASLDPEHVDQLIFMAKNIRSGVITQDVMYDACV